MFLVRYFKYGFQYKEVFNHLNEKGIKVFLYFMMLILVTAFPLNYLIVNEQGWRLDFIEESFRVETPTWDLPNDCEIRLNNFVCQTNLVYRYEHRGIEFVFNGTNEDINLDERRLIFMENMIVYTNGNGAQMPGANYAGFEETFSFFELNLMDGVEREQAYIAFGQSIESTFGPYIVMYSVLANTMVTVLTSMLFVLLLALVLQLFRFGLSTFFTFKESLVLIVYLMTFPAILSFIIGFFSPSFSPVIFQLGMGLVVMLVMLIYGKKHFA
jgi:maltodextrin utilization protein YvdJ